MKILMSLVFAALLISPLSAQIFSEDDLAIAGVQVEVKLLVAGFLQVKLAGHGRTPVVWAVR